MFIKAYPMRYETILVNKIRTKCLINRSAK